MHSVDKEQVAELCAELRQLLEAELAVGNTIVETGKGWPQKESLYVMLAVPFQAQTEALPSGIRFIAMDNPHYWKSESVCDWTHQLLACRFGP